MKWTNRDNWILYHPQLQFHLHFLHLQSTSQPRYEFNDLSVFLCCLICFCPSLRYPSLLLLSSPLRLCLVISTTFFPLCSRFIHFFPFTLYCTIGSLMPFEHRNPCTPTPVCTRVQIHNSGCTWPYKEILEKTWHSPCSCIGRCTEDMCNTEWWVLGEWWV